MTRRDRPDTTSQWRDKSYVFGSDSTEDANGSVEEEITKIDRIKDKDTGYWYNSDEWRDKSCVFGIFDVLTDEAIATLGSGSGEKVTLRPRNISIWKIRRYNVYLYRTGTLY